MNSQGMPWQTLPDAPGVYFFVGTHKKAGKSGEILYIGRATSLRDRVRSYFGDDVIQTRGPLIVDMVFQSSKIDFVQTDSVLEAVILEANLIKKYQPHYNTKEKSDKSFYSIVITKETFPRVLVVRSKDLEGGTTGEKSSKSDWVAGKIFGPYTNSSVLRAGLKILRKIFPFRDRCVPWQKGQAGHGKPCFNRQIGLCPGVCTGEISAKEYSAQIGRLTLFLSGKKAALINKLEKEMHALAKQQKFEMAHQIKRTLFALQHIQDISLVKEDEKTDQTDSAGSKLGGEVPASLFRIEGYDVAHLSGRNTVGVMTVLEEKVGLSAFQNPPRFCRSRIGTNRHFRRRQ